MITIILYPLHNPRAAIFFFFGGEVLYSDVFTSLQVRTRAVRRWLAPAFKPVALAFQLVLWACVVDKGVML